MCIYSKNFQTLKSDLQGILWWSSGQDLALSVLWAQSQYLIGELRFYKLPGANNNKDVQMFKPNMSVKSEYKICDYQRVVHMNDSRVFF